MVVARDIKGEIFKAWSRTHLVCSLLQAEVAAILWAVQLAKIERWNHVILEGDPKTCFDSLSLPNSSPDWSIYDVISNISSFKESLFRCSFCWVKRDYNSVAHVATKFSIRS